MGKLEGTAQTPLGRIGQPQDIAPLKRPSKP